ncbi:hypothetical protein Bhyg_05397 [Pseudolycoriella hygida]|uniref:Uncharacterized protein n=1 Tax=Pseudolycoriella hygida TaxID=35572 RepID=A0A9Q0SA87_9DIPT|nr:hypothetical protein Bhyg_05397 [Pseudolycoriella hygida]
MRCKEFQVNYLPL